MSRAKSRAQQSDAYGMSTLEKADLFTPRRKVRREQHRQRMAIRVQAPEVRTGRKAGAARKWSEPLTTRDTYERVAPTVNAASEADRLLARIREIGASYQRAGTAAPACGSLMSRAHAWTKATLARFPGPCYRTTLGAAMRLLWADARGL